MTLRRTLVSHAERICLEVGLGHGERAALKIDSVRPVADREAIALRALGETAVRVPPIRFHEPGDPSLLVLGWLDGAPLGSEAADSDDDWARAGRALRRLHDLAPPIALGFFSLGLPWVEFFREWTEREVRLCVELQALEHAEAQALERWILGRLAELSEPEPVFMHGDLQPGHVLLHADGAGLIDFGDSSRGDALWDLAVLALDHPDRLPAILRGYEPTDPFTAHAERFFDVYRLIRYLGEISWLDEHGFDPTASVAGVHEIARRHALR